MKRLQKAIADGGYCSRRKAEDYIISGKVKINGEIVTELGKKVNEKDLIEINGTVLKNEEKVYFLLNKPRNTVSTVKDDKKRKTVIDLISTDKRIYPVGRLDYDTTGLLILTNDGAFANEMMHPCNKIDKVYIAKINGIITPSELMKLKTGVFLDGKKTAKAKAKIKKIDKNTNTCFLQLTIHEGKNHQVKKMIESLGYKVLKLKREKIAFLTLDGLASGEYRKLSKKEISKLHQLAIKERN